MQQYVSYYFGRNVASSNVKRKSKDSIVFANVHLNSEILTVDAPPSRIGEVGERDDFKYAADYLRPTANRGR